MSTERSQHSRLLSPEDAERWRERVRHCTAPNGVLVMVDEIERLYEQLETLRRERDEWMVSERLAVMELEMLGPLLDDAEAHFLQIMEPEADVQEWLREYHAIPGQIQAMLAFADSGEERRPRSTGRTPLASNPATNASEPVEATQGPSTDGNPSSHPGSEASVPATCHHVNVTERPMYAIDDEPGHYLCLDCGDKFPLIGDTDKWEPKALDPAKNPLRKPGRSMSKHFMDDGVEYQDIACMRCHRTVVVATAAVLVADRKSWPLCGDCWRVIEAPDDDGEGELDSESHSDFTDSGGDPRPRLYP